MKPVSLECVNSTALLFERLYPYKKCRKLNKYIICSDCFRPNHERVAIDLYDEMLTIGNEIYRKAKNIKFNIYSDKKHYKIPKETWKCVICVILDMQYKTNPQYKRTKRYLKK